MNEDQDPGWRVPLRSAAYLLIPFVGAWRLIRQLPHRQADGLITLRMIFLGLVSSLLLFAFVLTFVIDPDDWFASPEDNSWFTYVVLLAGIGSWAGVNWVLARPLDLTTGSKLADTYRAQAFMGIGYAEFPALVGFVGTFLMEVLWIYLVGLVFSLLGLIRAGPTRRNLGHVQERVRREGSPLSIVRELRQPSGSGDSER